MKHSVASHTREDVTAHSLSPVVVSPITLGAAGFASSAREHRHSLQDFGPILSNFACLKVASKVYVLGASVAIVDQIVSAILIADIGIAVAGN